MAERTRVPSRILVTVGAALVLVGTSGCSAGSVQSEAMPSVKESAAASPDPTASAAAIDRVTCETYSDMLTILHNADYSFYNKGIGPQERTGWYDLAFRVIGRAPSSGEGPVAKALATLMQIRPPMATESSTPDSTSRAWSDASQALANACAAQGLPYSATGFVGG
jgi:hypothetical protein